MNPRLLSVILGGCLLLSATGISAEEVKSLPQIGVVKTWGELLAQKPVTLQFVEKNAANQDSSAKTEKPLTFRLGIDRTASKKNGGVLLYCFAQGDVAQIDQQTELSDPLIGPFLIDVRGSHEGELRQLICMATDRFMPSQPNALFLKPLPLKNEGTYVITLRQALGGEKFRDVASVKVLVTPDLEVSWSPWMSPTEALKVVESMESADCIVEEVTNPSGVIALPKWDGGEPIFFSELPAEDRLLPEWIAAKPDAGVELELKGNKLIVKLDEDIQTGSPKDFFLTRWWVNDKPFTPEPGPELMSAAAAQMKEVRKVEFRMEFHPEHLGVKEGDTVGLQLLFCPHGWERVVLGCVMECKQTAMVSRLVEVAQDLASKPIARMSNRINFVYSGNPQSPAKTDKP